MIRTGREAQGRPSRTDLGGVEMFHARGFRKIAIAAAATLALMGGVSAQTLTIGVRAGPESVDPHFTALGSHVETLKQVFDTLVWADEKLQLRPRLAESWTAINENTWEFKLRRGVKFHDGSDFTAEDVRFSIERIPLVTGTNPTTVYIRRVAGVTVVDPHTIRITTNGPAPTLPFDFNRLFIVSHRAAAGLTRETAPAAFNSGRAAIGTGPYRFVSWTPREDFVIERFDDHWGGREPWQRVVRREIPNDAARVAQLRAGQLDMITRVPAGDIAALERDRNMRISRQETVYVFNLELDQREQTPQVTMKDGSRPATNPFRDRRVREAVSLAIDRRAIAEVALEGMGSVVSQMVTPGIFGFNPRLPPLPTNVERARQLLAEAGYPNGFRFTLSFSVGRLPGDQQIGAALPQMLARVGLEVTGNGLPIAPLVSARQRGELSATMAGWGTITGESHYTLAALGGTNTPAQGLGIFNWRGHSNAEFDRLMIAAGVELNDERRSAMLQQGNEMFIREVMTVPIVAITSAWAVRADRAEIIRTRTDEETFSMDVRPVRR
jgi:peptide/nickel transport system substrate-binding protein